MSIVTRHIGLSLGADLCWPACFERLLERLNLELAIGDERIRFETKRVTIEPFDLRQPCHYDLVLDRLTHWYYTSREWIKKAVILNDLYVLNNPWTVQSMEKHTAYCAMMRLGLAVPDTWMVPPKSYEPAPDLQSTLERYAVMFDLGTVGRALGYPLYMKPYSGGGWVGVSRIEQEEALRAAYEQSGRWLMHLQRAVEGWDLFVRCVGIGPQVRYVNYDPSAPLHDRYSLDIERPTAEERRVLRSITLTINDFFSWDFNSVEVLHAGGIYHPIDYANACPDSQVTSLHYHFPWLVKAKIRWAIFCAATRRHFRLSPDWSRYLRVADTEQSAADKLRAYGELAEAHFDTARFEEFCHEHLPHLDEVAYEFFGTDEARQIVRRKVAALYPPGEVEQFTELIFQRIQRWRAQEGHGMPVIT